MIRRISTSATLFLRIFLPTFWLVFFGLFTLAMLFSSIGSSMIFGSWIFKAGIVAFYLVGALFLYYTLMKLHRVEIDAQHLYVTDYLRNRRYLLNDIACISETHMVLFIVGHIHLKSAGTFGRKIHFIQSRQKFDDYVRAEPRLSMLIGQADKAS